MAPAQDDADFAGQAVLGIDEAGRGPLAGPVVAAGVVLNALNPVQGLKDSKKLSEKARGDLYEKIMARALFVRAHEVDSETIDRINILQATLRAMRAVIISCVEKHAVDVALIDGNQTVPDAPRVKQIAMVKGDNRFECIMAASIIAKVHRDRLMHLYDQDYPGYGFRKHKGYGTEAHIEAIDRLGPCSIHRMSFAPLRGMVK